MFDLDSAFCLAGVLNCGEVARCQGTVLADSPLCLTPSSSSHHCTVCGSLYPATTVLAWLSSAVSTISHTLRPGVSVEECEETLHLLALRLHPGHHLLLQLKQRLSGLYGSLAQLSRPARERRLQLLIDLVESNSQVGSFFPMEILTFLWI